MQVLRLIVGRIVHGAVMMPVLMMMGVVAVWMARRAVGPVFRQKRGQLALQGQPPLLKHLLEHGILQQPQLPAANLQGHMAVAQVVGGL